MLCGCPCALGGVKQCLFLAVNPREICEDELKGSFASDPMSTEMVSTVFDQQSKLIGELQAEMKEVKELVSLKDTAIGIRLRCTFQPCVYKRLYIYSLP